MTRMSDSTSRPVFLSLVVLAALFSFVSSAVGKGDDEQIVKDFVDQFLVTIGEGDLDALPAMFV